MAFTLLVNNMQYGVDVEPDRPTGRTRSSVKRQSRPTTTSMHK
jgi:hypothetical protein